MWIECEGAEVMGGYEYALQRLDTMQFLTAKENIDDTSDNELNLIREMFHSPVTGEWTDEPDKALKAESLNGGMISEFEVASTSVADWNSWWDFPAFREGVEESDFEGYTEDRAWEFSQRFLKPGYRLVRIPFVNDGDLTELEDDVFATDFDTLEEYDAYRNEHPSRFYNSVDYFDYAKLRDEVFGHDAAIAAPGEPVPPDAPWSACSAEELKDRFGLPEWAR